MPKNILICDFHVGLNMTQHAMLRKIGVNPRILSLSSSTIQAGLTQELSHNEQLLKKRIIDIFQNNNLNDKIIRKAVSYFNKQPPWFGNAWITDKTQKLFNSIDASILDDVFSGYDSYLVSFPSSLAFLFKSLADRYDKQLIVNMGHRFNIGLRTKKENLQLLNLLEELNEDKNHILSASVSYEEQYFKSYSRQTINRLELSCLHLPDTKHKNTRRNEILIGPVNVVNDHIEEQLNNCSSAWSKKHKLKAFNFRHIRKLYKHFEYSDLEAHPAVIIFPYSAYSINMMELYELNIPFFVPSPELLIEYKILLDRALFPYYCTEKQLNKMSVAETDCHPFSPNSYDPDAQKYWMQYCYFYEKENCIIWNSMDDLMDKLHSLDLNNIRQKMIIENQEKRKSDIQTWEDLIL